MIKFWSEVIILGLMLYILQIRFTAANEAGLGGNTTSSSSRNRDGYQRVPDAVGKEEKSAGNGIPINV